MKMQTRFLHFVLTLSAIVNTSSSVHVVVSNSLDGKKMTLHCTSKDDDLGTRVMSPREEYSWDFNSNFWFSTLFYCIVSQGTVNDFVFSAYEDGRDYKRCMNNGCFWDVFDDDIYFRFSSGEVDLYYDWPTK